MSPSSSAMSPRFSIVIGLKFSDGGTYAVDQAARIAKQIPSACLHLVHVFPKPLTFAESQSMLAHLKLYESEKVASLGGLNGRKIGIHVRSGDIAREIVQLAADLVADLVVLGASDRTLATWLTPPTIERVMSLATCPVLVAGPKPTAVKAEGLEIEPACADCLSTRTATSGKQWWCDRHSAHAVKAHTFSYSRDLPFATHDSLLGPTGE